MNDAEYRAVRRKLVRRIMEISARTQEGHIPSSLSVLDILFALYSAFNLRPELKHDSNRDRFILSKGHAALGLYAVLEHFGFIPSETIDSGMLLGHPERNLDYGIEATTGSLGHGFPIACGIAKGLKLSGSAARVFCLVGDTEMEEGSCAEAMLIAARHGLSNLVVLVDANGNSPNRIDGPRFQSSLSEKFAAFGWFVSRINGHDVKAIARACDTKGGPRPFVVICDTVKGRGVAEFEAEPAKWHHRLISPGEAERLSP